MRILLTLSYDGSAFAGWQRQENAVTVQEVLEEALSEVFGQEVKVTGASRTDAGVHALGQRAAFTVAETKIPLEKLPYVINNALSAGKADRGLPAHAVRKAGGGRAEPPDVVVTRAEAVPESFHPRFDAVEKTYGYMYLCAKFPDPLVRNAWFCPRGLDAEKMDAAARDFAGVHDFAAFCAAGSGAKTTVREIYECRVENLTERQNNGVSACRDVSPMLLRFARNDAFALNRRGSEGRLLALFVRGNGFLYNMVRIMAGTLLYVGEGKLPADCVPGIIKSGDRTKAGMTAPAMGLTLMEVKY
ncbi:MAG: tRNA pseudouridine synthase A [Firmicutes bacterium]|nr:tRNA pseudouridine synthase A [Bacillota bacterium]